MAFRPSNFKCLRYLTVNFYNGDMHIYYYTAYENESDNDKAALITALQKIGYRIEKDDETKGYLLAVNDKVRANEVQAVEFVTKKNLPAVKSKHSKKHITPNDRLAKIIFGEDKKVNLEDLINPELIPIKTTKTDKFYVCANISFRDLPENMQSKLADRFTRAVCDTMTSLILAGNEYITPQQIAFAMNGYTGKRAATDSFLEQIKESVEILRNTNCKIDASKEAQARGYNFEQTTFDGYLIPADGLEVVYMNGQKVKAYRVFREPILYLYARQKKQVLTVDIDMLALPDKINMTRENIILQRYLLERIEGMKNEKNNLGCIILYETIFEILGAQELSKVEKKRIRQRVKIFLDNWVDLAYIKGYEEEKDGGLIRAIRITLFEDEPKKLKG